MKKLIYFMSLACIMMFAACSSDDDNFTEENNKPAEGELVTIGVGMPGADETRVEMNTLTDMVWSSSDILQAWAYKPGWTQCLQPVTMNYVSGAGTKSAKFSGTLSDYAESFVFSYKGAKVEFNEQYSKKNCKFDQQVQKAVNDFSHLKDHLLFRTDKIAKADLSKNITFAPNYAILKLNIKNFPTALKDASDVQVLFYTNYEANKQNTPKAAVTVTGKMAGENNYVYMAFDPTNLFSGKTIMFEFKVGDKVVAKASAKATAQKQYIAGKIYTVTINDADKNAMHWETAGSGEGEGGSLGYSTTDFANWVKNGASFEAVSGYGIKISAYDTYVYSPAIKLGTTNIIAVNFSSNSSNLKEFKRFGLAIREVSKTETPNQWTELELSKYSDGVNAWANATVTTDISAFAGQTVEVALHFKGSTNRTGYFKSFSVTSK